MEKERITAAVVGQEVHLRMCQPDVVKKQCDKDEGRWACITHKESFPHQWAKDSHIRTGKHVLVWMCNDHGAEAP